MRAHRDGVDLVGIHMGPDAPAAPMCSLKLQLPAGGVLRVRGLYHMALQPSKIIVILVMFHLQLRAVQSKHQFHFSLQTIS